MTGTNIGQLGININRIGKPGSSLRNFWTELSRRHQAAVRNPEDPAVRARLKNHIAANPGLFREGIPEDRLHFAIDDKNTPGRVRMLTHLLVNGFPLPAVRRGVEIDSSRTTAAAAISNYFYEASLSFLSAARKFPDFLLVMTAPFSGLNEWIITEEAAEPKRLKVQYGLTFLDGLFSFVQFTPPLAVDYLFPIDSYFKNENLAGRAERFRIPLPGSRISKEAAEDKRLYHKIFQGIDGLSLPFEEIITAEADQTLDIRQRLIAFARKHGLSSIFMKPYSEFGGRRANSFNLQYELEEACEHARALLSIYGGFLVQEYLAPVPLAGGTEDWNIRQYAIQTQAGLASRWKRFRVGPKGGAINTMRGARSLTQSQLLDIVNLTGQGKDDFISFLALTDRVSVEILKSFQRYLATHHAEQRVRYYGGGSTLEPDFISLDLIVRRLAGCPTRFELDLLEINAHDSGGIRNYDVIHFLEKYGAGPVSLTEEADSLAQAVVEMMRWRGRLYKRHIDSLR